MTKHSFVFLSLLGTAAAQPAHLTLAALRGLKLPDVALQSATRQAQSNQPPFVQVEGVIGGNIEFELLLPEAWNKRFVMGGGGGFVGTVQNGACDSVYQGYATAGTDTGHEAQPGFMAGWALDNVEAQLDFGYLAIHRTVEVAQAIIRQYYGERPSFSYFTGCSRGGGQAMMEAQRYPADFDGIVAGAPAFNWTGIGAVSVAIAQTLYPDPAHLDKTALDRTALAHLQQSIIDQCDAQDGLKDGVVQDPPSAHFDLSKVPGLDDRQRAAIAAIYAGAHNSNGLIYPGYTPGAECDSNQWYAWIVGPVPQLVASEGVPDLMFAFGTQVLKNFVFDDPNWNYATYNFAHYARDTRRAASFLNATSANLDAFKARQGKLILWHGWADPALPAQATVNYYRQLQRRDPGAKDYCRLFMIPGCFHCGGGPGASEVDWLSVIVQWVEHGQAPERLIASKTVSTGRMTRPLFSYPSTAVYKGSGDPDSASSFVERAPQ